MRFLLKVPLIATICDVARTRVGFTSHVLLRAMMVRGAWWHTESKFYVFYQAFLYFYHDISITTNFFKLV